MLLSSTASVEQLNQNSSISGVNHLLWIRFSFMVGSDEQEYPDIYKD
jgi:hypothetical protein